MKPTLFALAFAALAATGCVTYYKSSDVKDYFGSGVSQADKAVASAERDLTEKEGIIASIRQNVADPSMAPYPDFDAALGSMKAALDAMKAQDALLKESRDKVNGIVKGKKTIQSDEEGYKPMLAERKRFDGLFDGFKDRTERYKKESEAFNALAKKNAVVRVSTANLEKQVQDYRADSDRQIANARSELDKAGKELDAAVAAGYDPKKADEKRALLARMGAIVPAIEGKRDEVLALAGRFRAEAGDRGEYYVGPGMASHELLAAIREKSAEIAALSKEMNGYAKQFNDAKK